MELAGIRVNSIYEQNIMMNMIKMMVHGIVEMI